MAFFRFDYFCGDLYVCYNNHTLGPKCITSGSKADFLPAGWVILYHFWHKKLMFLQTEPKVVE